jgi:hypothetical protein
MSRTVNVGFAEFLERLVPKYSEPESAEINLAAIERCLKDAFDMAYIAPYGSTGHGTNVAEESARDYFAVVRKNRMLENCDQSLERVRDALEEAFPDKFITEGRPVIVIPFGESRAERHHIVPAFPMGNRGGNDTYGIPGPAGRWVESCPGGHSAWLSGMETQSGNRLKAFIRIVKAWNYHEGEPVWPFYLEHAVADFFKTEGFTTHSIDLKNFFTYVLKRRVGPYRSTAGSGEPVYGTSVADKFDSMDKLRKARELTDAANFAERRDNVAAAFYYWRKLFGFRFPQF